jgi:hypothetical protein
MSRHFGGRFSRLFSFASILNARATEPPPKVHRWRHLSELFLQDLSAIGRLRGRVLMDLETKPQVSHYIETRFLETLSEIGARRADVLYERFINATFSELADE